MGKPDSVFFSTILFSLKFSWDDSIPTAMTNGKFLKFSPTFFTKLDKQEREFVLVHEAMHVAYMHMVRLNGRNPKKWNMATDFVINGQLKDQGWRMPEGGLYDPQYKGMSAEQVYDALTDEDVDDLSEGFSEDFEIVDGDSTEGSTLDGTAEQEIVDIVMKAATQATMAKQGGTIPADIKRQIDSILYPKLPWHIILERYMTALTPDDYSFKKFNRRYMPDFYFPTLRSESLDNVAVIVDASGSVSQKELTQFLSEISAIHSRLKPNKLTVVGFDTRINSVDEVSHFDDIYNKVDIKGGGGTLIEPVMEWINTNQPALSIIFTDGEFYNIPEETNNNQIIWAIYNNENFQIPFGKVIHYDNS